LIPVISLPIPVAILELAYRRHSIEIIVWLQYEVELLQGLGIQPPEAVGFLQFKGFKVA